MGCYYVIGIRVNHRSANAAKLQEALTKYGCNIKLRVGLHETDANSCSDDGVILLQACGEKAVIDEMIAVFCGLNGVTAKLLDLN